MLNSVSLFGEEVEQIDGSVRMAGLYCLVESKDETDNITIAPIAKIRNQLLRRPSGTIGLVFSTREFEPPVEACQRQRVEQSKSETPHVPYPMEPIG